MPEVMTEPGVTPEVASPAPVADTLTDPVVASKSRGMQSRGTQSRRKKPDGSRDSRFQLGIGQAMEEMSPISKRLRGEEDAIRLAALFQVPAAVIPLLLELVRRSPGGYPTSSAVSFIELIKHKAWNARDGASKQQVIDDLIDRPAGAKQLCVRLISRTETTTRLEHLFDMKFEDAVTLHFDDEKHDMIWTPDGRLGGLMDRVQDRVEHTPTTDRVYIKDTRGKRHAAAYAKWNKKRYWAELAEPGKALTEIAEGELAVITAVLGRMLPGGAIALKAVEGVAIANFYRENKGPVGAIVREFPAAVSAAGVVLREGGLQLGDLMSDVVDGMLNNLCQIDVNPSEALRFAVVVFLELSGVRASQFDMDDALGAIGGSGTNLWDNIKIFGEIYRTVLRPYARVMGAQARLLSEGVGIGESDSVLDALRGAGIKATDAQLTALAARMQSTGADAAQELLQEAYTLQGYLRRVHRLSGSLEKLDKVLKIL